MDYVREHPGMEDYKGKLIVVGLNRVRVKS